MVFDARTDLREAAVSMAAVSMLAACTVTCPETDIGKAVSYNNGISVFGTRAQQNRWVENARLSLFLQERIQSSGIGKSTVFNARPTPESCTDCMFAQERLSRRSLTSAELSGAVSAAPTALLPFAP